MSEDSKLSKAHGLFQPGFGLLGGVRTPGQGAKLLLGKQHLRVRTDTSAISRLTKPAEERKEPVYPGSTADVVREPSDVFRGLGLGDAAERQLELELRNLTQLGSTIEFRKSLVATLRALAPDDFALRSELHRRATEYWKARMNPRRPVRGERIVIQKSLELEKARKVHSSQLSLFDAMAQEPTKADPAPSTPSKAPKREATSPAKGSKAPKTKGGKKKGGASVSGGPYYGPKGGKWADPDHKIPWKEPEVGGAKGGARKYAEEAKRIAEAAPAKPKRVEQLKVEAEVRSTKFKEPEELKAWLIDQLPKRTKGSALNFIKVEVTERVPVKIGEWGQIEHPAFTRFSVEVDHQASIPGHALIAHITEGVVTNIDADNRITKQDYERAHNHVCDVCQTKRKRKQVYVVHREADGAHILVGGECAKEFQGANLVNAIFAIDDIGDLLSQVDDGGLLEDEGGGGGGRAVFHPQELIAGAWAVAKHDGYVSRGAAKWGESSTADVALMWISPTPAQLRNMTAAEKKEMKDKLASAKKEVAEEWPKIQAWIKGELEAADKRGEFNEFFASLDALVNKDAVDFKALGRLAWVAHGYFDAKLKEFTKKKQREEGFEPGPYRGGSDKKLHDLPGEWTLGAIREADDGYSRHWRCFAQNMKTGERISFRQSKEPPDEWTKGHTVKLRGKVKSVAEGDTGPDGKERPGITFMTHVSEQPTKEDLSAAAKAKAKVKAERAEAKARWMQAAKDSDFWRSKVVEDNHARPDGTRYIMTTVLADLERDRADKLISPQLYKKLEGVWADQVEAALRSGKAEDEKLALRLVEREAPFAGRSDNEPNLGRFAELRTVLHASEAAPTTVALYESALKNWPELAHKIKGSPVANEAWEEAQRGRREAEDADAREGRYRLRRNPLHVGMNLTGQLDSSSYADRSKPNYVAGERLRTKDALRLNDLITNFETDMAAMRVDPEHASGGKSFSGSSYIPREQTWRRGEPRLSSWNAFASGGYRAAKFADVVDEVDRLIERTEKSIAEYDKKRIEAEARLAESKDATFKERHAEKAHRFGADADYHRAVLKRAEAMKAELSRTRPMGKLELLKEGSISKSVTDADLDRLRPRLMMQLTKSPLELVWMAEEVPDELGEVFRRLPPGHRPDEMLKAKYIKREGTPGNYVYTYRKPDGSLQQVRQKHINPGSRGPYKKTRDKQGQTVYTGGSKPPGEGWEKIPESPHGGMRRPVTRGKVRAWEFWYPEGKQKQEGLFDAPAQVRTRGESRDTDHWMAANNLTMQARAGSTRIVDSSGNVVGRGRTAGEAAQAAEEFLNERDRQAPKPPAGQLELFKALTSAGLFEDVLIKGAGHKYIKRIPTGKPKPKYRYIYREPKTKQLVQDEHLVEGAKFKVEHNGQLGHFEVRGHDKDKGVVTVRHDESGRTVHMKAKDLHRMIERSVGKKTRDELTRYKGGKGIGGEPLKLRGQATQPQLPGTGKTEFPQPSKPKKPAPQLKRAKMSDLGKGGYDDIVGFSQDARELEEQARALKSKDREFAVIPQAGGFVLASKAKAMGKPIGDATTIFMRGQGERLASLKAEYVLMEADDVVASHNPTRGFSEHKDYPKGVQERDYQADEVEAAKVHRIARTMEPAVMVNSNPSALDGAPIVTEDGVVLGGNGRSMGMQLAYDSYPENGKALKDYLAQHAKAFGLSPAQVDGMKKPILVRRVSAGKDTDTLRALGRRMNEPLTQGLDPRSAEVALGKNYVNQAMVDALVHAIEPDETLNSFLRSSRSEGFLGHVMRGVIDQTNLNEFTETKGKGSTERRLNEDGRLRVERVLAARMIPDAKLLGQMQQSLRQNIAKATPYLMKAEAAGWDVRTALKLAVAADVDMRERASVPQKQAEREAARGRYLRNLEIGGAEGASTAVQKNKLAMAMFAIIQDHNGPRKLVEGFKQFALQADRAAEPMAALMGDTMSMEDALAASFSSAEAPKPPEPEKPQADTQTMGMFKSMDSELDPSQLSRYVMHAVNWELERLVNGAIASVEPGKALDGKKVLAQLRSFIVDQAHRDKRFARGMGVQPLDGKVLEGLLEAHAKARVSEIAKSLAIASLCDNLRKAGV